MNALSNPAARLDAHTARPSAHRESRQITCGVAHDLKNLLNPVSLYLQLIQRSLERGRSDEVKEHLDEIRVLMAHSAKTIDRLLDESAPRSEAWSEPLELDRLAREACMIAKSHGPTRARWQLGELERAPVLGRSSEVVSALVNLMINSLDALRAVDTGTITLRSGHSRTHAWVQVADDGPGMPPDVSRRAFEPFFTTKGAEGNGLGLALVSTCMKQHHGWTTLETTLGQGTRITLVFPAASAPSQRPGEAETMTSARRARGQRERESRDEAGT